MCDDKVETIKQIQPIKSLKEVQDFLGFTNCYRRFIRNYSKIALPLSNSTAQPATKWKTSELIQQAQETLKRTFCEALVLVLTTVRTAAVRGFSWHFSKNPIKTSRAIKYLTNGPTKK